MKRNDGAKTAGAGSAKRIAGTAGAAGSVAGAVGGTGTAAVPGGVPDPAPGVVLGAGKADPPPALGGADLGLSTRPMNSPKASLTDWAACADCCEACSRSCTRASRGSRST